MVVRELKRIGYVHVTLDLQGYRRGSAQAALVVKLEEEITR
jgi:PP-loop superfamily ATP-utilizing enzyme